MERDDSSLDFFARFTEHLNHSPDRTAFRRLTEAGEESFTYGDVGREIRGISRHLQEIGIEPKQRVGLLMENHPRWGMAFLAGQSAGAILVPLDVMHSPETLAHLIRHSECSLLFSSEKQLPLLAKIKELLEEPPDAVVVGDSGGEYTEWDSLLERYSDRDVPLPLIERDLDDPLLIMYTSGTTGSPKGVVLSGRNLYRNVVEALRRIDVKSTDSFLNVLPLYHILSLMVHFIIALYAGARVSFLDVVDAQKIVHAFREEKITIFVCVPQFYYLLHRRILKEVEQQGALRRFLFKKLLGLSRFCNTRLGFNPGRAFFPMIHRRFGPDLRYFGVGGARFDREVAESLRDLGFSLVQAYGMTETGALAAITPPSPGMVGSVGTPLPHVEIRVDQPDEQGIGEVLIRGENVMLEYYKNPEATREAIDEDRWLHSGDLGYLASGEKLYITGRKKDVIVLSSGKNIFPEEIEQYYEKNCSFIKEMCVVGKSGASSGREEERLHAVIVPDFDQLKAEQVVNASDMIRYCIENISQKLPPYKRIRTFEIWQEPLPRTTTRKVKRFEVEEIVRRGDQGGRKSEPEEESWKPSDPLEEQIAELIDELKPGQPVRPGMNLELDVGLDSLERVELLSNIQDHFQVLVADDEAMEIFTVEDLMETVRERLSDDEELPGERRKKSWSEILSAPLSEEDAAKVHERLRRRPFVEFIFIVVVRINQVISKILFRLKGEGLENLPRDYPFMICPNHLSYVDAFVVAALLPSRVIRRFFALGYSDYFGQGLAGYLGRLVKTIPVDADRRLREALRLAAEGIRQDLVLCVFPEGERSIDGNLKSFRKGPAILATELDVPVVPTGIVGSYEVWRRGSNQIRLRPIRVRFGEPIRPREGETAEEFNDRLREAVQRLVEAS